MKAIFKTLVVASALMASATLANAETVLKFGHPAPDGDLTNKMAMMFAEDVKSGTNGSVTVQVFPNGQLGTDEQLIDGVRSGILDFTLSGLNNFTGMIPKAGAFSLPFMFPTREVAYKVLDGDVGQGVLKDLEAFNIKGLEFPENGYRNISNNKGPVRTPAELYTALETGVVDAQDHPIWVVEAFKFYEVQKYLSLSQHAFSALTLAMNLDTFNKLTADEQKVVLDAAAKAVAFQRTENRAAEEKQIAFFESQGMEVNRDVDGDAFQKAAAPVWESFKEENGEEIINAILAASK
tara:strand:- start:268 stop:1149 length:882 start_codon:yes stop_codon:yes gene_type:complete